MKITRTPTWAVHPESVDGAPARLLLHEYFTEIVGRYHGRPADPAETAAAMAEEPSDHLRPLTGLFLLGRYDGTPAGCVGLRLDTGGVAEITRLYVRPTARGSGAGRRLLGAVESAALAYGVVTVRLETRHDLVEARALYAGHGYREVDAFSASPYSDHWFEKRLGVDDADRTG